MGRTNRVRRELSVEWSGVGTLEWAKVGTVEGLNDVNLHFIFSRDTNDIFTLGDIRAASDGRSHGQSPNPNFQPQRDSPQEQPMNVFSDNGLFFEDEEDGDVCYIILGHG